jgi:ribosomal-protein-alanine N-acetyltransferase
MTNLTYRTMTEEDQDGVARVGYVSWLDNRHYPEWFDPAVEARAENWLKSFVQNPKCDVVVCLADRMVIGWGARDSHDEPGIAGRPRDYISDLWIDPHWQGRGVGTALLTNLVDRMQAEGLAVAKIEVAQANLRAIDLYVRQGFRETWRGVRMSETLGLPLPRILLEKQI